MKNRLKHLPFVRLYFFPAEPRTDRQECVDFALGQLVGWIIGMSIAILVIWVGFWVRYRIL